LSKIENKAQIGLFENLRKYQTEARAGSYRTRMYSNDKRTEMKKENLLGGWCSAGNCILNLLLKLRSLLCHCLLLLVKGTDTKLKRVCLVS